jgi:hypothetical protein
LCSSTTMIRCSPSSASSRSPGKRRAASSSIFVGLIPPWTSVTSPDQNSAALQRSLE